MNQVKVFPVKVRETRSPTTFIVCPVEVKSTIQKMERVLKAKGEAQRLQSVTFDQINPGDLVAVRVENEDGSGQFEWKRGQIIKKDRLYYVSVLLIDHGKECHVKMSKLRQLGSKDKSIQPTAYGLQLESKSFNCNIIIIV